MAEITKAQAQARYSTALAMSLIPESVRKSIDDQELADRIVYARWAGDRSQDPRLSLTLRRSWREISKAALTAQPRDITRQQVDDLLARAEQARSPAQADALRRKADELLEQNPIAPPAGQASDTGPVNLGGTTGMGQPRQGPQAALPGDVPGRQVIKSALKVVVYDRRRRPWIASPARIRTRITKADDGKPQMQAVFDQAGNLVGVIDPEDLMPVAAAGKAPAAPDGAAPRQPAPAADPAATAAVVKVVADAVRQLAREIQASGGVQSRRPGTR